MTQIDHSAVGQDVAEFPKRGGANGSLRFYDEVQHGANAGTGQASAG